MSLANSDFGDFGDSLDYDQSETPSETFEAPAPPPPVVRQKGFSIYTVMLIISFVMLFTAAIMLFSQLGTLKA